MSQVALFVGGLFGFYWWVKGHWFPALVFSLALGVVSFAVTSHGFHAPLEAGGHSISDLPVWLICLGLPWLPMAVHAWIKKGHPSPKKARVSDSRMVIRL